MGLQLLNFHVMFCEIRSSGFSYLDSIMNNQLYLSGSQHEIDFSLIDSVVLFKILTPTFCTQKPQNQS